MTDAPDWVHVVSGPGGGAITGVTAGVSNQPQDLSQIGWTQDYHFADTATIKLATGVVYASLCQATLSGSLIELGFLQTAIASGLTSASCWMALYDQTCSSATPLAISASGGAAGSWDTAILGGYPAFNTVEMNAPYNVTVGTYYMVCFLAVGTTPPTFGQNPYPTEPVVVGNFLWSAKTNTAGFTSLATNAFAAHLETTTPQIWATLGSAP